MVSPNAGLPRAVARLMSVMPQTDLAYRASVGFWLFQLVTRIYLYAVLWRSLYAAGQSVAGIGYTGAVTYSTLASLQTFTMFAPGGFVRAAVRDGSISYSLLRPLGLLTQLLSMGLGAFLYGLAWLGVGLGLTMLLRVAYLPATWGQAGLYALSLALAYLVSYHLELLLGLSAFWTVEIWGVTSVYHFTSLILSGAVVPLWFFPDRLRELAVLLPFAAVASTPISIFIGRLSEAAAWRAVALQAIWAIVLALGAFGVWKLAERKVVVQGG